MLDVRDFFQTNSVIIYSIYGQVFLVLGLLVALQYRKYSRLDLARHLWLLAGFGITHGLGEWGYVFIPIQATYLKPGWIHLLGLGQLALYVASFTFLFQFGIELLASRSHKWAAWLRPIPTLAVIGWALLFAGINSFVLGPSSEIFVTGDVLARYMLALPGALLAMVGLWLQSDAMAEMGVPNIGRYFRRAAVAFGFYALAAGLVVSESYIFPSSVINDANLQDLIGVPITVFRSVLGVVIAYFVMRGLQVFQVEMDKLVEDMERESLLATERERVGRELHDGVIQSLYAAGLALEDAGYTIDQDQGVAKQKVESVIFSLNRSISDIRTYIMGLESGPENGDIEERLESLAREFQCQTGLKVDFSVQGERPELIMNGQATHAFQIATEALTNAKKHSGADSVLVELTYASDHFEILVRDNGCGFQKAALRSRHGFSGHGMKNMAQRAKLMNGHLEAANRDGQGLDIRLRAPYSTVQGGD